ncbi:cytochrome b [Paraburkholderia sp. FT54]|uniref:cytochrome b n=1 Tax=Paraburkholderia sp. FT54 TaxID=3074437 RepID=UPI0038F775CE
MDAVSVPLCAPAHRDHRRVARRHPLTLLAGLEIPPFFGVSHNAGATVATVHTWLGDAILWVAGFHALAGLYHHFVLKDNVLVSMLPRWLPLRRSNGD